MHSSSSNALNVYKNVGNYGTVDAASPHQLIQLLLDGARQKIAAAKGYMQRNEVSSKGEFIGKAINIVEGLRISLDREQGGETAANLDNLYEYMGRRLLQANLDDDSQLLDEVSALLQEISSAWGGMPQSERNNPQADTTGG